MAIRKKITKKQKKRLLRLISAHRDMQYALVAYRSFLKAEDGDAMYNAVLTMVISYCRPFTENDGLGCLQVDYPNYPDYADDKLNQGHYRMMDMRNKFIAHSSADGISVIVTPPGLPMLGTKEVASSWSYSVGKREFLRPDFVEWLHQVTVALHMRLMADISPMLPLNAHDEVTVIHEPKPSAIWTLFHRTSTIPKTSQGIVSKIVSKIRSLWDSQ